MTPSSDALVFDTGPLRHFAVNGWLGVLKFLAGDRPVIVPESVEHELKNQIHDHPALCQVLDAGWISVDRSNDMSYLIAFAAYEQRLVANGRNRGECGVLALGRQLTVPMVEALADDLISGEYFLPFGPGGFRRWAQEEGLIEYE